MHNLYKKISYCLLLTFCSQYIFSEPYHKGLLLKAHDWVGDSPVGAFLNKATPAFLDTRLSMDTGSDKKVAGMMQEMQNNNKVAPRSRDKVVKFPLRLLEHFGNRSLCSQNNSFAVCQESLSKQKTGVQRAMHSIASIEQKYNDIALKNYCAVLGAGLSGYACYRIKSVSVPVRLAAFVLSNVAGRKLYEGFAEEKLYMRSVFEGLKGVRCKTCVKEALQQMDGTDSSDMKKIIAYFNSYYMQEELRHKRCVAHESKWLSW